MKNLSLFMVALFASAFVACTSTPTQTIENLKAAADGESTASSDYAAYSQKAREEGYLNIAKMFEATSYAESRHAAKHLEELAKLGVKGYQPNIGEVQVKTTAENLKKAIAGEQYEFTSMYPGFIETAIQEKAQGANNSFEWANRAEKKHAGYYTKALQALESDGSDQNFQVIWKVCPKCGDTYTQEELITSGCELCGTPIEQFKTFAL